MTLHDISTQLHSLSVGGYFNREKFSRQRLHDYIVGMFREPDSLSIKGTLVMEIALPDGRWHFTVNHYSPEPYGFDYTIPDDREQEARILALLQ